MSQHPIFKKLNLTEQVEWKTLGEVLIRTKGTKITAGQMKELHKDNAPLRIFAGGKTFALVDFSDIPTKDVNKEPSIIVKSRGVIEFEYYDKPFSHKNEMWSYHSKNEDIDIKFVYYFLKQQEPYFQKLGSKMQMPQIATPDTDKFQIPIPPPAIQREIVKTLDEFTEKHQTLKQELIKELDLRKKQYQYYRDLLLDFDNVDNPFFGEVEVKCLGEVVLPTSNIRWKDTDKSYLYIDLTSVSRENNSITETIEINSENAPSRAQKIVLTNDIIFATTRPTQQRLCLINDKYSGQIASTGYCILRAKTEIVHPKWIVFNLASTDFKHYVEENQSGSAYPAISDTKVKDFQIPIPPLDTQAKIVEILDKFDTLTNSISEGLPREIELRQKQYEYYRDMLLSFPS